MVKKPPQPVARGPLKPLVGPAVPPPVKPPPTKPVVIPHKPKSGGPTGKA